MTAEQPVTRREPPLSIDLQTKAGLELLDFASAWPEAWPGLLDRILAIEQEAFADGMQEMVERRVQRRIEQEAARPLPKPQPDRIASMFRRVRMACDMIEPMEREEAGRPGRRDWLDVDEAWAILLQVDREWGALPDRPEARPLPEPQPLREALERLLAVAMTEEEDVSAATQDEWIAAIRQANDALDGALPDRPGPSLNVEQLEPILHDILPHLHGPHEKRPNPYYVEVAEKFLARLSQPPDPAAHEVKRDG